MRPQTRERRDTWSPPPQTERRVLRQIDALLASYALDGRVPSATGLGGRQLDLPLTPESRHLPRGFLPTSPFELSQRHVDLCAMHRMRYLKRAVSGSMVVAYYDHAWDGRGRCRPIVYVHPEHLGEQDEPTCLGRFAALRELGRLIAAPFGAPHGRPLTEANCTVQIHAGDYLKPGFFADPLNRWAMSLGCPPAELRMLLRKEWGELPVNEQMVRALRPMFVEEPLGLEGVFFERRYEGQQTEALFGLDKHAILAWARHNGFVNI